MTKCAVIVSRNDNYGDNLVHRTQHTLNCLSKTFDHIVYVDWKTIDKPLTSFVVDCPDNVTTISVTKEKIQEKWPEWYNIPVIETIGRNIGVRYAIDKFDWICSTNIDILIESFDESKLDVDTLYTARRYNVPIENHIGQYNTDELLNYVKANKNNFTQAPLAERNGGPWDSGDYWSLSVCCGDFQLAHKSLWKEIRGFEEEMVGRCYADSNLMKRPILIGKKTAILDVNLYHLNHTSNSYREEGEHLPVNDQQKYVANWNKSTNTKDWGLI